MTHPLANNPTETFVRHYAEHRNVLKASMAAGITRAQGQALLARKDVAARIGALWGEAAEAAGVTPDMVFRQMRRFAFPDVRGLYDEDGQLKPIHELDDDTAATIVSIDVETRYDRDGKDEEGVPRFQPVNTVKIRRVDPMPALTLFARHFKLVDAEGEGVNALAAALADRLQQGRRRAYGAARTPSQDVEDARIIPPTPSVIDSQETPDEQLW